MSFSVFFYFNDGLQNVVVWEGGFYDINENGRIVLVVRHCDINKNISLVGDCGFHAITKNDRLFGRGKFIGSSKPLKFIGSNKRVMNCISVSIGHKRSHAN